MFVDLDRFSANQSWECAFDWMLCIFTNLGVELVAFMNELNDKWTFSLIYSCILTSRFSDGRACLNFSLNAVFRIPQYLRGSSESRDTSLHQRSGDTGNILLMLSEWIEFFRLKVETFANSFLYRELHTLSMQHCGHRSPKCNYFHWLEISIQVSRNNYLSKPFIISLSAERIEIQKFVFDELQLERLAKYYGFWREKVSHSKLK